MPNQNGRTHREDDDTEQYGGGQSGYGSGRDGDDRSMGPAYRNQAYGDRQYDDRQGMHTDERFTGRGGEGYWADRTERTGYRSEHRNRDDRSEHPGYNSGYNQGGMGFGGQGGGVPREMHREHVQGFRGGSGGAQIADDYNRGYPDMYGPNETRRWANVPQSGMSTDWGRMQENYGRGYGGGMQGNYGGSSTGYGGSGSYGMRQSEYQRGGNVGQPLPGGGHRGKGPQGYIRSDDRIREQVCEALADDDHIDATHIEVVVKNGEVMLTGMVEDRRQKRLAEDCVEHLPGVRDVQNQLRCAANNRGNPSSGSAVGKNETEMSSDKKHRA